MTQFLDDVQKALGVKFADDTLLQRALTHDSILNEKKDAHLESNERLEFLGDSVIDLVVSKRAYDHVPGGEEELHLFWEKVSSDRNLANIADKIHLTKFLLLSVGEKRKPVIEVSIRAGALEAVIGAIFLDAGLEAASRFIEQRVLR